MLKDAIKMFYNGQLFPFSGHVESIMAKLCITSLPIIAQDGVQFQASSLEPIGRISQNKLSQHANMLAAFFR